MKIEQFKEEFVEVFGFLLAQELQKKAPKDTGLLSKSFPGTFKVENKNIITFKVPFYWEYVEFLSRLGNNKPNPNFGFTRLTLEKNTDRLAEQALQIISTR